MFPDPVKSILFLISNSYFSESIKLTSHKAFDTGNGNIVLESFIIPRKFTKLLSNEMSSSRPTCYLLIRSMYSLP